jgi:Mce-associated membrane protein
MTATNTTEYATANEDGKAVPVDTEPASEEHTPTVEAEAEPMVDCEAESDDVKVESTLASRGARWRRVLGYGVLPALVLLLAMASGYCKWVDSSLRDAQVARFESVRVAAEGTVALLSYKPDTVEKDLGDARNRLTGDFKDSYTSLTHDVVIPGATQKQISAVATVPAAASVSATENHAVVLVFVNQTVTVGTGAPTDTASSVRVTLDKVADRWLISGFDPV